jgi:hypothetical protein
MDLAAPESLPERARSQNLQQWRGFLSFRPGLNPNGTERAHSIGMRSVRRFTQILLSLLGAGVVAFAVYRIESLYERALIAALGLVVMELGIWQVTRAFFPNEREFKPLRHETDFFLKLVRRMNRAALLAEGGSSTAHEELDRLEDEMHHSIERMRRLAGRTAEQLGLDALPTSQSSSSSRAVASALRASRAS